MAQQSDSSRLGEPTLVEDLLLLLFQPDAAGTIAGENTLFYTLAGAVLADLALGGHVRTVPGRAGSTLVQAVEEHPPAAEAWARAAWSCWWPSSCGGSMPRPESVRSRFDG